MQKETGASEAEAVTAHQKWELLDRTAFVTELQFKSPMSTCVEDIF
jgi:hypothetical protein